MIDRSARNRYATILRHLATGQLSTDTFSFQAESICRNSKDPVLSEIHEHADGLYSDLWAYRLRGRHALDASSRRAVARMILLLRSDETEIDREPVFMPPGPLGWLDLVRVFSAIIATIHWGVLTGAIGLIVGAGTVAKLLHSLHLRERTWTETCRKIAAGDTVWPFASVEQLAAAKQARIFLHG
ncbi:MAG: hypothetical protein HEQ23_10520 [Tepidisphaera sp.]